MEIKLRTLCFSKQPFSRTDFCCLSQSNKHLHDDDDGDDDDDDDDDEDDQDDSAPHPLMPHAGSFTVIVS